jgi:asparagine synthetase B (glutamine-hydrolysing)
MCGLYGYAGPRPKPLKLVEVAWESARRRGPHGAGLWCYRETRREEGAVLMHTNLSNLFLENTHSFNVVLGHARLATFGTYDKFQPLTYGEVALTHNGNFRRFQECMTQLKWAPKTDIDSEGLLALAVTEREWEMPKWLDSPYAIVFYRKGSVFMIRDGLPLFVYEKSGLIRWSSVDPGGWEEIAPAKWRKYDVCKDGE